MLGILLALFGMMGGPGDQGELDTLPKNIAPDTTLSRTLQVNRILIIGNKITRDRIILRELSLQAGDTINSKRLNTVLTRDKNKVYNLFLFNTVTVQALELPDNRIDLLVEVEERWYIFPIPIFELSDRNFNEWWQNYGHDITRVNYGIRLYRYNFRGRNETLRLTAQFGFTRRFELSYRIPNLDRKQKNGMTFLFDYSEPKNAAYFTDDHKLVYLRLKKTVRTTLGAGVVYSYRKSFYETHSVAAEFRKSTIIDTIQYLNPNYYPAGKSEIKFGSITYSFSSDHRDVRQYPLKGYNFTALVSKAGLGLGDDINQFEVNLTYSRYAALKNNFYLANFTSGYLSTPTSQPYVMYSALGYQRQFIRGYEIYVIEGPKFFLNKTTLKKKIFSHTWRLEEMPLEQFRHFPLTIYLKAYTDFGYVENYPRYNEIKINTALSDRLLAGAGFGIDIVSAYDSVFRLEYTFTREKTNGFFFHLKKEF